MTYSQSQNLLTDGNKVKFTVSLGDGSFSDETNGSSISSLPLYVSKWSFRGEYLGFVQVTD